MVKSTDKLRYHVCDKGGEGVKKFEIFMDVIDGSPLGGHRVKGPNGRWSSVLKQGSLEEVRVYYIVNMQERVSRPLLRQYS